jgi:CDP-glucose 4,6-dehydratase
MSVTAGFWNGRRVFLTGHTGFKGAWLALWLARMKASVTGYALPAPTQPSLFEAARIASAIQSVEGDIRDLERLKAAMRSAAPEVVFHLAAQALVRASYDDPLETFSTNLMGTVNLLEACRELPSLRAVVVVTSDKCYEEHPSGKAHREGDPLGGHDPYAASKACAEIATAAYRRSFFGASKAGVASARAGNVIGGGDWGADRLLPDLMRAFSAGERVRLRNPAATRPWQHVLDPLAGYLMLAERLSSDPAGFAEAWNFGPAPKGSVTVETVANRAASLWGKGAGWEIEPGQQPREAPLLALDPAKAGERLGWRPRFDLERSLEATLSWYKEYYQGANARALVEAQLEHFMELRPA